jgi:hypothetical protein
MGRGRAVPRTRQSSEADAERDIPSVSGPCLLCATNSSTRVPGECGAGGATTRMVPSTWTSSAESGRRWPLSTVRLSPQAAAAVPEDRTDGLGAGGDLVDNPVVHHLWRLRLRGLDSPGRDDVLTGHRLRLTLIGSDTDPARSITATARMRPLARAPGRRKAANPTADRSAPTGRSAVRAGRPAPPGAFAAHGAVVGPDLVQPDQEPGLGDVVDPHAGVSALLFSTPRA